MMRNPHIIISLKAAWHRPSALLRASALALCGLLCATVAFTGCEREPELHLLERRPVVITITNLRLDLETYWDYRFIYGLEYDWESEWWYGWDETDRAIFGEIGYTLPSSFNVRRYYTGSEPYIPHSTVYAHSIKGNEFTEEYQLGFWDLLVWNDILTPDNVQSLNFDETSSLDSVIAYTNESMRASRQQAPRYAHAFYQPEELFSAYDQGILINENRDGFEFDSLRNVWVKKLKMTLQPVTYIYLVQVILRHNNNKVVGIEGTGDLSSMARTANINNGKAGGDPVTVQFNMRMKKGLDYGRYVAGSDGVQMETADIIGGRLLTFGIPDLQPRIYTEPADTVALKQKLATDHRHYLDLKMQFNNGDSTFVFDVTKQVQKRFRGGVITVELDMDTIPVRSRTGGSGFDAVVKDFEEETHEFTM